MLSKHDIRGISDTSVVWYVGVIVASVLLKLMVDRLKERATTDEWTSNKR